MIIGDGLTLFQWLHGLRWILGASTVLGLGARTAIQLPVPGYRKIVSGIGMTFFLVSLVPWWSEYVGWQIDKVSCRVVFGAVGVGFFFLGARWHDDNS